MGIIASLLKLLKTAKEIFSKFNLGVERTPINMQRIAAFKCLYTAGMPNCHQISAVKEITSCILINVKRFHRTAGLIAFLSLAAWANVQVMVCCWSFSSPAEMISKGETAVSDEHACCHHQSHVVFAPVSVIPDGSGLISIAGNSCCNHKDAPALQSTGHGLDLALAANIPVFHENVPNPTYSFSATPVRNTGPPVFLAFQRLLI